MSVDIGKVISKLQDYVDKLNKILPQHWKGNDAPNTHHWDAGSIKASADLDIAGQNASLKFDFTDGGIPHTIAAVLPFATALTTGAARIVLDGAEQASPHVAFGARVGLEGLTLYDRIVVELKFVDAQTGKAHDYRFDGDVP